MKVTYKSDKVNIEVDGKDTKDCFSQLAGAVEVFGSSTCGACDSHNTVPVVRENQGNTYYEIRCQDCGASLAFGQRRQDGALFPRKKDKDGNYLNANGWTKFRRADSHEEPVNF
jgi:hypothetical protein